MAVFRVALVGRWSEDDGWVEMSGLDSSSAKDDASSGVGNEEMDDINLLVS